MDIEDTLTRLPDGTGCAQIGTVQKKWVDDFGGSAVDPKLWEVYDGGIYKPGSPVNGTGVTGISHSVTNSELRVVMGTTANAELWFVSKDMFTSPLDLYITAMASQRIVNNTWYFELVECDPNTGELVPHATVPGEVSNRGGILYHSSATAGSTTVEATCDDSPAGNSVVATSQSITAASDLLLEVRPQDLIFSGATTDSIAARNATGLRLSRQVPDPNRAYKLRMRFKNLGTAPASSTTITIFRALICDVQELIAEISSGRGDAVAGKGIAVNVTSVPTTAVNHSATTTTSGALNFKRISTADVNNALIKSSVGRLLGGVVYNSNAAVRYLKLFNKSTAPIAGTDTPVFTIALPPGQQVNLSSMFSVYGLSFASGIGMALTTGMADLDTGVVAAGEILVSLTYI